MDNFDERSSSCTCVTSWGGWHQTINEVGIEVKVPSGTHAKEIKCDIGINNIKVVVKGNTIIEGKLPKPVHKDESIWTLEDRETLQICLVKTEQTSANCWKSLLVGKYEADAYLYDQMQQKLTLHRFQLENPGMDFSAATVSGCYQDGGPSLPPV